MKSTRQVLDPFDLQSLENFENAIYENNNKIIFDLVKSIGEENLPLLKDRLKKIDLNRLAPTDREAYLEAFSLVYPLFSGYTVEKASHSFMMGARMFENGAGVDKNLYEAIFWYQKSFELTHNSFLQSNAIEKLTDISLQKDDISVAIISCIALIDCRLIQWAEYKATHYKTSRDLILIEQPRVLLETLAREVGEDSNLSNKIASAKEKLDKELFAMMTSKYLRASGSLFPSILFNLLLRLVCQP